MKKAISLIIALLFAVSLLAGCSQSNPQTNISASASDNGDALRIVTTIFPHYDFARAVAGGGAQLTMLLKPGAESHSYDPSPADIMTIQQADVFIYTGGHNDAWVDSILSSIDTSNMKVLRMMDYVQAVEEVTPPGAEAEAEHDHDHEQEEHDHEEEEPGHEEEHDHSEEAGTELDEHIWTSPKNAALMVAAVADTLAGADTANADTYRSNADAYIAQIDALDGEFRSIVADAKTNMIVIADRFPFRYFTDEYGIEYRAAFPGCSTDSNPSAGTVAALVDTVREYSLPYVYTIELSTGNIAGVLSDETGCGVLTLHSCHNVTRSEFESGATYVSLMRQNVKNLQKGMN